MVKENELPLIARLLSPRVTTGKAVSVAHKYFGQLAGPRLLKIIATEAVSI
jgi:hypothetical protein